MSSYVSRSRGRSFSQPNNDEELQSINNQLEFIKASFKHGSNDLENLICVLRNRQNAEEDFLDKISKMNTQPKLKKATSTSEADNIYFSYDFQRPAQNAINLYKDSVDTIIEGRRKLKDTIAQEIVVLTERKKYEEALRKKSKDELFGANNIYALFKSRDLVKAYNAYKNKCKDLYNSQVDYANQLEQQQQHDNPGLQSSNNPNRNSSDMGNGIIGGISKLSGEYSREVANSIPLSNNKNNQIVPDQQHKKGTVAGLLSQMKTRASGSNHTAPLDQNKQNAKFAKMKKDISDADNEYRKVILKLEDLRKKQIQITEKTNKQLENTIKGNIETIQKSLKNILESELEAMKNGVEMSSSCYSTIANIRSDDEVKRFSEKYQNLGFVLPSPVRYKNRYMEGECKEILFGGSLEAYFDEHKRPIPVLVTKCVEAIEGLGGLQREGIYRVSGRQSNIDTLKHEFELNEERVILDGVKYDVFTIATVLKNYIRELDDPLFDFDVRSRSLYTKNMPQDQRLDLLKFRLSEIPSAHRATLFYIVSHLAKVCAHSEANKMTIQNIALIFTPAIFHDFNQSEDSSTRDWSPDDLFEDLILHHVQLFSFNEEATRGIKDQPSDMMTAYGQTPFKDPMQQPSNLLHISPLSLQPQSNNLLLSQPASPNRQFHKGENTATIKEQDYYNRQNLPPNVVSNTHRRMPSLQLQQQQQRIRDIRLSVQDPMLMNSQNIGIDTNTRVLSQANNDTAMNNGFEKILPSFPTQYNDENNRPNSYYSNRQTHPIPGDLAQQQYQLLMNRSLSDNTGTPKAPLSMENSPGAYYNSNGSNAAYLNSLPDRSDNESPIPSRRASNSRDNLIVQQTMSSDVFLKRSSNSSLPSLPSLVTEAQQMAVPFPPRIDSLSRSNPQLQGTTQKERRRSSDTSELSVNPIMTATHKEGTDIFSDYQFRPYKPSLNSECRMTRDAKDSASSSAIEEDLLVKGGSSFATGSVANDGTHYVQEHSPTIVAETTTAATTTESNKTLLEQ